MEEGRLPCSDGLSAVRSVPLAALFENEFPSILPLHLIPNITDSSSDDINSREPATLYPIILPSHL